MEIIKRILADIKDGENIDLYLIAVISLPLVVLEAINEVVPDHWISSLTFTVLALLSVSLLVNRRTTETIRQQFVQGGKLSYLESYPASLTSDIKNSRELWIVAINLQSTLKQHYSTFEEKLKRGDSIRVLLMDPNGFNIGTSISRTRGHITESEARDDIRRSLRELCHLKVPAPERLEIRALDYPLQFGAFAVNPHSASGLIYWENYPYNMPELEMPKSLITTENREWYHFYRTQIENLWVKAVEWEG